MFASVDDGKEGRKCLAGVSHTLTAAPANRLVRFLRIAAHVEPTPLCWLAGAVPGCTRNAPKALRDVLVHPENVRPFLPKLKQTNSWGSEPTQPIKDREQKTSFFAHHHSPFLNVFLPLIPHTHRIPGCVPRGEAASSRWPRATGQVAFPCTKGSQ